MAVEIANAYVSLVVTSKGIGADLEKELGVPVAAAAKKAGDQASASLQKTGQQFTKFGIGALGVAGAVGVGLFKLGSAASDLGESINAVKVTFGPAAAGILKLGEDAAKAMGLSNTAFNGLAVQFSAFATTIAGKGGDVVGTLEGITQRAADFASVMNIEVADAATIFQSALAGETEPIRKFGIDLSAATVTAFAYANGIANVGTELTEGEKVQARYALLMQSTAKTQGDFANTSDSAANAMRIAKAEAENAAASLGTALAPAMATAAGFAADLAHGFVTLNNATGGWLIKGVAVVGGIAALAGGFSLVAGQVIKFKGLMTSAEGGLNGMGKAAAFASKALGLAAIAVAGMEVANKLTQNSKGATLAMNQLVIGLDEISKAGKAPRETLQAFQDTALKLEDSKGGIAKFFDAASSGFSETDLRLKALKETFDKVAEASPAQAKQITDALLEMQTASKAGSEAATKWLKDSGLSDKEIASWIEQLGAAAGATEVLTGATEADSAATVIDTKAQEERNKALKQGAEDLQKSADSLNNQVSAMRAAADATFAEADATDSLAKFNAELSKKLKDAKGDQSAINAIYREGTDLAAAHADAVVRIGVEHQGATGHVLTATEKLTSFNREMLFSALNTTPAARKAIIDYVAEANNIPAEKTTEIEALIAAGKFEEASSELEKLSAARTATVEADAETKQAQADLDKLAEPRKVVLTVVQGYTVPVGFQGPLVPLKPGPPLPKKTGNSAMGTSFWPGGESWVAENGPEIVDLPRGSIVHNASDTSAILAASSSLLAAAAAGGGGGPSIVVNNNRRDIGVADLNHVLAMARLAS